MRTMQGRGKLYRAGEYVCDTRYYLTWEEDSGHVSTFTGRQVVEGLMSAEGSLVPDEPVFDAGEELQLELENGARLMIVITEGDSSDPLSALLVRVTGK